MNAREREGEQPAPARASTVAVVLASGSGTRLGAPTPKQFIPVAGKSSLEHVLDLFQASADVDEILVMVPADHMDTVQGLAPRYPKVSRVLPGGATRNETSRLALEAIPDDDTKVLLHDAVRPLLPPSIITACVAALDAHDAVDVAIPSADTIIQVDEDGFISDIPPRATLRRGQTPQGFRRGTLYEAYRHALRDPDFTATDDCSVVLRYLPHVRVFVVPGSEENIKITEPTDLHLAEKYFQLRSSDSGQLDEPGSDLAGRTVVVFGASSGIGKALVEYLADVGADVHGFSRSDTGTDIRRVEDVRAALKSAGGGRGVDHVVVTAGVLHHGQVTDVGDGELRDTVDTNVVGSFLVARESFPFLAERGGSLLLFASSSYTRGRAGYAVYSATKAAIVNAAQALAEEWAPEGVRVNCVCPARTATPMRLQAFGSEDPATLVTSSEVAEASARVLASTATGQVFEVRTKATTPVRAPRA